MGVHPVTQQARAYKLAVRQHHGDEGTKIMNNAQRVAPLRAATYIHIPTPTESARKAKIVKVNGRNVRRVTYR